jgi:glycosyltransferase involved in cell wall biosynthesis
MSQSEGAILFLTSWYPVDSNLNHGIFIRNHAIALSKFRKVVVVYAYSSDQGPHYDIHQLKINDNLTEYRIRYTKPSFNLKPFSSAIQYLKLKKAHRLLIGQLKKQKIKISAIQINVIFPVALVMDLYKEAFSVPFTVLEHWSGYTPQDGNYNGRTLKRVTEKCINTAIKIWHISDPQKTAMLQHGLKGNFELIYNAVDADLFVPAVKQNKRIKLLHVSSLVEREKNISGTLVALKSLQQKGFDFDFTVIGGEKEEMKAAKELTDKLKLKNIEFIGIQKPEVVAQYMQQSTALILFSHFEGMPVVVLEALSCGLPVIASKVGQLPYIITNEFGVLVDVNYQVQLISALEKLLRSEYQFNTKAMRDFIIKHASFNAVGKQMNDFYNLNAE